MKKMIFILMAVFTFAAFGSFVVPDNDVGESVVMVAQDHPMVATMDIASVENHTIHSQSDGNIVTIQAVETKFETLSETQQPDDDVGWDDRPGITSDEPPNRIKIGSAGGNPGWRG